MSQPVNSNVSVILVNWNTSQLLDQCLSVLLKEMQGLDFDIWVVDNGSTDSSLSMLRDRYPQVQVIENPVNVGFAAANNQGMQTARGSFFLLINTDAFPKAGAIQQMVQLAEENPKAGIIGAHLLNPDGSFQGSYVDFPDLLQEFMILTGLGRLLFGRWYPNHAPRKGESAKAVDYVQGACLLVRRQAYEAVGGLDEGYFMYSEEVDWCYAMRKAGWQVWYQPGAEVTHIGGASSKERMIKKETDLYVSRVRFFKKNYGSLPAALLRMLILSVTTVKFPLHWVLQRASSRRLGRGIVSPVRLYHALKGI